MSEPVFSYGKITKGNQLFFLNSTQIGGIQSISANFQNSANFIDYIGNQSTIHSLDAPQNGNININALLVTQDQFINLTGDIGTNGYIIDSQSNIQKNYSFQSGYLTNYSSRCSIGEIPQVSVGISVLGDMGRFTIIDPTLTSLQNAVSSLSLLVAGPGSINLGTDTFSTNAVKSYTLSINVPRIPSYVIGTGVPIEVRTKYPLEVTTEFEITLNDYIPTKLSNYPLSPTTKNMTITVNDYITNTNITSYSFSNMLLVGESYSAGVGKDVSMNLSYKSQVFR